MDFHFDELEEGVNNKNECLEIPNVTVKFYTPLTRSPTDEVEEDISEETVSRRHMRYEIQEKRIKQWDTQMTRERNYNEGLRKRMLRREGKAIDGRLEQEDGVIFETVEGRERQCVYPKLKDIRYLHVTDDASTYLFGHPMPKNMLHFSEFKPPFTPRPVILRQNSNSESQTVNQTRSEDQNEENESIDN